MQRLPALLFALTLVGCGTAPAQAPKVPPPDSAVATPSKTSTQLKPEAVPSGNEQHVPTGWVRMVNRKHGRATIWGEAKQIEPVGDYCKILCRESGKYLALEGWALDSKKAKAPHTHRLLRLVPDAGDRSMFWRFEPLEDGYWRIVNRESGQCLVFRDRIHVGQAPLRDGALEQQWRLEPVSPPPIAGNNDQPPGDQAETRPTVEAPPPSPTPAPAELPDNDFRLIAATDLIYTPKEFKGAISTKDLFLVLRGGKAPEDGFFDVEGKPVAPVWTSSASSVLSITTDRRTGKVSFAILRPGKTTVTVSVGRWSDQAELTVVQSPFSLGVSRRTLLQDFEYPSKKYIRAQSRKGKLPAGFDRLPQNLLSVHGSHSLVADRILQKNVPSGEFWEYQQWPRCLLLVSGRPDNSVIIAIVTRPSQEDDPIPPELGLSNGGTTGAHPPGGAVVDPAIGGFQLVAQTDLIYLSQGRTPTQHTKGPRLLSPNLFHVLYRGERPDHGYFSVDGKPVVPSWRSTNASVMQVNIDDKTGQVSFGIFGAGKTTVTVSLGKLSDHRELTVVEVPIRLSASAHDIVKSCGFPDKKIDPTHPPLEWRKPCVFGTPYGRGLGMASELWVYSRWPRCVLALDSKDRFINILTRPPEEDTDDAEQNGNP